jgi:predicted CoA-substrate-specific enzyme activase
MREIGLDIGSVSLKYARFINRRCVETQYLKHHGKPYSLLLSVLKELKDFDVLVLTGSSARAINEVLGAHYINEVNATARGVMDCLPEIRSIIEIGGEDSKLININGNRIEDFSSNTICAAGTGIFLDQQARRLCFSTEEFGEVALKSTNPARIAGRCSVFAKSDMIHLQQIGTKPEDLMCGLCYALARNFKSVIAKGKRISTPVAFVGGVAANQGMIRAFHDVLDISRDHLVIPEHYNCLGAIGAVLSAREHSIERKYSGWQRLEEWLTQPKKIKRLAPLNGHAHISPSIFSQPPRTRTKAYLGVDVGSISTNLVLIDTDGTVLSRRYLWTKGRPIEVVLDGLRMLKEELGDRVEIAGVGTTGSGRYLIGEFIGADLIKNEISAQARAAVEINPDVDTIFEIGGQDSKYIQLNNRTIVDFEMNKVCAAGTGSFLEEQAEVLGVELNEFGDRALNAQSPINLGERCTVFIGSEVIHHQRDINERENLLAGLGYSIAFNYLNRVVSGKKVGTRIFFQGGVAANKAVVSAFEQILHKKITVPLNYDITGAIGIALLTRDANINKSSFRGLDLISRHYKSDSFVCTHCSNECEINRITIDGEQSIYYGGRCGRYEKEDKKKGKALPNYFALRNKIFFKTENMTGKPIGIPRSLIFYEMFPFFYRFLTELGFKPILSNPTTRRTIEDGSEVSVADTCLPVKVALGHIRALLNEGVNELFIPSVITMTLPDTRFDRCFVCPYVQTIPYMARSVFGDKITVHAPPIYFDRGKAGIEKPLIDFAQQYGIPADRTRRAISRAHEYQCNVLKEIMELGKDIFESIEDYAFVICSRPYNGYDLGLNLDLPKKIRELGVPAIPLDFIPLDYESIHEDFQNMYWHYGQRLLAAAETIRRNTKLFGVYISNFSCGPDSFLTRFFKEKLGDKPCLLIELDEHSGDAGFITRCEAFCDSIKAAQRTSSRRVLKARSEIAQERTIYIPDMCDSAHVLAAAMCHAGIRAEMLDPPDEESTFIGRQYTSGRECFPAILTAGDMIKKIRSSDFNPDKSAFFMAQGSGPCRFGQYYKLHRTILDEMGYSDIPIYAPNQGPSLFDDLGPMGIKFLTSTWDGICAVDALENRCRSIRPYEIHNGMTDKIYSEALQEICSSVEQGKNVLPVLKKVRKTLNKVPRTQNNKPKIGIVGEIYVRSQRFSNGFLIQKLEEMGCETALPSIGEWFFYTNFTRIRNCNWFRQYRRALFTKLFDHYMRWRHNKIYSLMGLKPESDVVKLLDLAAPVIHQSFEGETILTLGKTIECIREHYAGVVNVMPFTCMPGNIVTTLYKRVKSQYPDFPLFVLSFDGLDHAINTMRLETFVNQAQTYLQRTVNET